MWNFEGKPTTRRGINLGGNVSHTSKQDLLQKTRDERRRREQLRIQNKMAKTIQSAYRGYKTRLEFRHQLRVSYDRLVVEVTSPISSVVNYLKGFSELVELLIQCYDVVLDLDRLAEVVRLGLRVVTTLDGNKSTAIMAGYTYEVLKIWWPYLISKLMTLTHKNLSLLKSPGLNLLNVVTEPGYYRNTELMFDGRSVYQYQIVQLAKGRVFATFRSMILAKQANATIYSLMIRLLKNTTPSSNSLDSIYQYFIIDLMGTLSLHDHLTAQAMSQFTKQIPSTYLLSQLHTYVTQLNLCNPTYHNNVFYFNVLGNAASFSAQGGNVVEWCELMTALVVQAHDQIDIHKAKSEQEAPLSDPEPLKPAEPCALATAKQLQALTQLYSSSTLTHMFAPISSYQSPHLAPVFQYLVTLSLKWPQSTFNITTFLLFNLDKSKLGLDIIPGLFGRVESSRLFNGLVKIRAELVEDSTLKKDWLELYLLTELLHHQLTILGDDPVINNVDHKLLSGIQFEKFITHLGMMVFGLYYDATNLMDRGVGGSKLVNLKMVREKSTRLLKQVHDKDSRRPFLKQGIWLSNWPMMQQQNFASMATGEMFQNHIAELMDQEREDDDMPTNRPIRDTSNVLNILQNIPFIVPFEVRVDIFSQVLALERQRYEEMRPGSFQRGYDHPFTIRRGSVFEDGYANLNVLGDRLKGRVAISLVNQLGMAEAGIDGGGVFKEFLNELILEAFSPDRGLFLHTKQNRLYPSPAYHPTQLSYYEFLGKMVGKALYEGILIDVSFARFFLSKWLNKVSYLDDLPSLDTELAHGLKVLKEYSGDVEYDFSLNFTLTDLNPSGSGHRTVELILNGESTPVTQINKIQYIYQVADYRLNKQFSRQSAAFLDGLAAILPSRWLALFDERELEMVIGGGDQPIDVKELRSAMTYSGVFHSEHPQILALWHMLEGFDTATLGLFVKFITSCARPPLQGFKALNPPLCIRDSGDDATRLPTASTCVNLLKLPVYPNITVLKEKLLYAIHSESGFELS